MNRVLNRPAPLDLKSKIVERCRQFDKNNPQKKTEQKQNKRNEGISREVKAQKQRQAYKIQQKQSTGENLTESVQLLNSVIGYKQKNVQVQSREKKLFNLIKVSCSSFNQIKSNSNNNSNLRSQSDKNEVSIQVSEADSIRHHHNLQLPIDSLRHSEVKTASFRSQRSEIPIQTFQSRVIQTINFKTSNKKDHSSSKRIEQKFHPITLQREEKVSKQTHSQQNNEIFNILGFLFSNQNPSSDSKINVQQSLITPQKDYYPTQKKKPQSEQHGSPTLTLPINSMVSRSRQQVNTPVRNQQSPEKYKRHTNSIKETPAPKINIKQEQKKSQIHPQTTHKILSIFANLGQSSSSEQIQLLKERMKNQKNLKLRDYLRLASLSNDARFDNYKKQNRNNKSLQINNLRASGSMKQNVMKKSSLFNKNKTAIDSQKSISLIKTSLNKKLQKSFEMALKVIEELQKSSEIAGKQYDDLVFMCNLHRLFDENIFKTTLLLQDLFQEYKSKRKFTNILEQRNEITEETVIELLSPKKKRNDELTMSIFEKILIGLNIIKKQQLLTSPVRNYL